MRTVHRIVAFLLPALLLMTRAPIAVAQSPNEQARKWFTRSQRENAPSRQIEALQPRQSKRSSLYPLGVTVTIVLVPLFGLMFLAPTARANFYLWRRNYPAAARTLEKLLERHPKRAGLYGPLAELYLQLGRNDERALRVYQTVLRLNLPTRRRDEINTLLAQKYLAEGRTDSEVIEVLENALKVESRNQNSSVKALPAKPRFVL